MRRIAHFSCGAASAVAAKISSPDEIWYAETGGEDSDNERFLRDCEEWFGQPVIRMRSKEFASTWDVWEKVRYIGGIAGAPCTRELKVEPLREFALPSDIGIIGYTADKKDSKRTKQLEAVAPDLIWEFPLIERGITKANCLAILETAGIKPPRVYGMGFHNANCIPCSKAVSPGYWALVREHFPNEFERMDKLCREIGARPVQFSNRKVDGKWVKERGFPGDVPLDTPLQDPVAPACDMLCTLATKDLLEEE